FEIGNEKDEVELRGDGEHLPFEAAHDIEAAVAGRSGVIGMLLPFSAELEDIAALEWAIGQFVQSIENAEADGGAAAEPARCRNLSSDRADKWKTFGRRS